MRILYVGKDERSRVVEIHRIKFLESGFTEADNQNEYIGDFSGKVIVVHIFQNKGGGRRLTFRAPDDFPIEEARMQILREDWLDLCSCQLMGENRY